MPRINESNAAVVQGVTTISVDGVTPMNLVGVNAGNPQWLIHASSRIVFGYEVTPAVFGLGRVDVPSGALVNINSTGQNQLVAGGGVWAAFLSGAGVYTSVSGFGPLPLAGVLDATAAGDTCLVTDRADAIGIAMYDATGAQGTSAGVTLVSPGNVRSRGNVLAYEDANGWHLRNIATGALIGFTAQTATVTLMIPFANGPDVWLCEYSATFGMTVRGKDRQQGYVLPLTIDNFNNPDAALKATGTARIAGAVNAGEAPTELRVFDLNLNSGALSVGVTSGGALVFASGGTLPLVPMPGTAVGGSASIGIEYVQRHPIAERASMIVTDIWRKYFIRLETALQSVQSSVATLVATVATVTDLTHLLPAWMQFSAASRLLGRGSLNGAGNGEEISLGAGLTMTGTVLSATASGSGAGGVPSLGMCDCDSAPTIMMIGAKVTSADVAQAGYWSPLTNGDPVTPELIFDGDGDTIAVWTPLP